MTRSHARTRTHTHTHMTHTHNRCQACTKPYSGANYYWCSIKSGQSKISPGAEGSSSWCNHCYKEGSYLCCKTLRAAAASLPLPPSTTPTAVPALPTTGLSPLPHVSEPDTSSELRRTQAQKPFGTTCPRVMCAIDVPLTLRCAHF
jgi:hypothetical protein